MKVEVIYEYAKDDTDFASDCEYSEVWIDGKQVNLPFESDYPEELTKVFIQGLQWYNQNYGDKVFLLEETKRNGDW